MRMRACCGCGDNAEVLMVDPGLLGQDISDVTFDLLGSTEILN